MKYLVEIEEVLSRQIEIEANTVNEAISIAEDDYRKEKIVLDASDFIDVDFKIIK